MGEGRSAAAAAELESLVGEAESKLARAQLAAEGLRESLAGGGVVDPADLDLLSEFNAALRAAREVYAALEDGADAELTVPALRVAVAEIALRDASRTREHLVRTLSRLAATPTADGGPDLAAACRSRAGELLEDGALEDEDALRVAGGLVALVELNEASDQAEKDALYERAKESLPVDCQAAIGVAMYGNLMLAPEGPESESEPEPESESEPEPESEAEPEPPEPETAPEEDEEPPPEDESPPEEPEKPEPAVPADDSEPSDEEVEAVLAQLLRERRYGLAHWIVSAWPAGELGLQHALKALAYAGAMRNPAGESASRLRELVEALPFETMDGDKTARRLALVAGLRGTLLAPNARAGGLLTGVAQSFSQRPGLAKLIEAVVTAGQRGLSAPDMTEQVQSMATAEDNLAAIQGRAAEILRRSTIKYQRATNVWRRWTEPEGLLGWPLRAVVENRTGELDEVDQRTGGLRDAKMLGRKVDETDRKLKAANRKQKIVRDAREKLIEWAEESLGIVAEWIEVSRELERARRKQADERWQDDLLESLRTAARDARDEVTAAWEEWGEGEGLQGAAAAGTWPMMEEVFALVVDGKALTGEEDPIDEILGVDLLRVFGLGLDARLEPDDQLQLGPLLAAARLEGWDQAFEERVREANFAAAERIVEVVRRGDAEAAAAMEAERIRRLQDERGHLDHRFAEAQRKLDAARREGRVSEDVGVSLGNRLGSLELEEGGQDFRGYEASVEAFLADLAAAEEDGIRRTREAYEPRFEREELLRPHRERLLRLLEGGELSTLEELVLAIERGEDLPEEGDRIFNQLIEFFPRVSDDEQIARAVQEADGLRVAIAEKGEFGALSFATLKDEELDFVLAAIESWQRLAGQDFGSADEDLTRVLRLIGLVADQSSDFSKLWHRRDAKKRRQADFAAIPFGKALIPAFGSGARDSRYRLLMLWERMSDEAIAGHIAQTDGEQPLVLLCFGTPLPQHVRRGVADELRHQRNRRAVALVDGPAFLYLASKGGGKLATTMRITMPFSAINPYTPFAPGSVPVEMFYGRDRELADVLEPIGTCFIYGGRRLGKSALLRAAERDFNAGNNENRAVYIDLKTKGIGEREHPGKVVTEIARALKDADVMTFSAARDPSFEDVSKEVKAWLEIDSSRRLLLLLDECDIFLNEDAKDGFVNVTQLKALMEETNRRFKPVLAGLHQVRRFQKIPNQPLAHLGFPTPVGPLKPQPAYDLITKPLEALGLKFETEDLPTRILTATNYQPSLIQLFCSELVEHMLKNVRGPGMPPYPVTSRDVDDVSRTPRVVEDMRDRFEQTTNLDPRYRVIANSVAFESLEGDPGVALSASEIRAMCDEYWPVGFADTGADEFRALLEEMDSLGVLFKNDSGRFLMRSPNVLRMLGTAEQIEEQLNASNELELPVGFEASSFRNAMGEDVYRRQPLTHQQVAGLLVGREEGSQLRVVVGSRATGIEDVVPCLQEVVSEDDDYAFQDASAQPGKRFLARIKKGVRKKHPVVGYELTARPAEALALIRAAADKLFDQGVDSTVVFVLGTEALPAWQALVVAEGGEEEGERGSPAESLELVELKRWTKAGLRAWAQGGDVELFFNQDRSLAQLIQVTGGWPMLVNRVVDAYREKHDWKRALTVLEQWLDSDEGSRELCDAIGLGGARAPADAWNLFIDYAEPIAREEFQLLAEDEGIEEADRAAELLRSMQVLELNAKGEYVVEATAARAWRKVNPPVPDAAS